MGNAFFKETHEKQRYLKSPDLGCEDTQVRAARAMSLPKRQHLAQTCTGARLHIVARRHANLLGSCTRRCGCERKVPN